MKNQFRHSLNQLKENSNRYDKDAQARVSSLLTTLGQLPIPKDQQLLEYHDTLLFIQAYPGNSANRRLAAKDLKRIAAFLKSRKPGLKVPENEGLPFTPIITRFSPDFLNWLARHPDLKLEFDSFYSPVLSLNDILNITLPALLKAETTAGRSNADLLETLHIKPAQYIHFLLGQLDQLKEWPLLQDLFTEKMDLYVKLVPRNAKFSRSFNQLKIEQPYFHQDLLKNFDRLQLLNQPLASHRVPSAKEKQELLHLVRNSMALTVREIDPATYMEEATIRLFELERGLVLTVYSMIPERQLPLETYFGFTFLKNGIPVSYGGIWAFGKLARVGLNIFEPFRGGESGYVLCQLLRVFIQAFGVSYFELEPYQFGLDNPGGIQSGAFWFYYKFGFRPVDPDLRLLAEKEYHKIKTRNNYRSSTKTLLRFTESNICLNLHEKSPQDVLEVTARVLKQIKKGWDKNYKISKQQAVDQFCRQTSLNESGLDPVERRTLEDTALWARAMNISQPKQLECMKQMVLTKTKNDYAYQEWLVQFFEQ